MHLHPELATTFCNVRIEAKPNKSSQKLWEAGVYTHILIPSLLGQCRRDKGKEEEDFNARRGIT